MIALLRRQPLVSYFVIAFAWTWAFVIVFLILFPLPDVIVRTTPGDLGPLIGTLVVTAAAAKNMPRDFRVSITNAPGKGVYPISSFTWLLLYENPKDKAQSHVMVDFLKWALGDGQKYCAELGYAPLPPDVVKLELAALANVKTS